MDKNKIRHDFINNGLRIEVLNRMITEALETNQSLEKDYIEDLIKFLNDHVQLAEQLKDYK